MSKLTENQIDDLVDRLTFHVEPASKKHLYMDGRYRQSNLGPLKYVAWAIEYRPFEMLGETRDNAINYVCQMIKNHLKTQSINDAHGFIGKPFIDIKYNIENIKCFEEPIFLGGFLHSYENVNKLHARVDYGLSAVAGMDQNGMCGHEFSLDIQTKCEEQLKSVHEDIKTALGINRWLMK